MKRGLVICLGLVLAGCAPEGVYQGLPARHWFQQLKHPDATARVHAARAMAEITPRYKRAIPVLTELLKDNDTTVRWAATFALAHYGPDAKMAIPNLLEMVEQDPSPAGRDGAAAAARAIDPARFSNLEAP